MKPQSLDAEPSLLKVGKVAVTEKSVLAARKYPKRKRGKVRYGDPEFRDETLTEFQKYEENLSDDNDETYKPDKKDKPTSESDEDTSNQLTIKAQTTSNQPPIKSQKDLKDISCNEITRGTLPPQLIPNKAIYNHSLTIEGKSQTVDWLH
ncbi:uncharacterized protein LOC130612733 isoform X2 [Hydractinia symbiolongicarpus]|uniref:uncharacterized protein LOC130612733 isoform X2 n=1 Tax=Hydractinia symbiolongicarpus TaxID=13093 RepID=UPI0025519961|nr:uncharacterized protein LOC130612733 isoform X2 [Hydractinia symbiolongicarpus]